MQTIEYTTKDKSQWGEGEWQNEPDKRQWKDEVTGLPCLIVRNHNGAWCGYVGVSEGHPFYKKDGYDFDLDVHGGITFTGYCSPAPDGDQSRGICHLDPENENVWWLGFDCHHAWDFAPEYELRQQKYGMSFGRDATYKNIHYVTRQVTELAKQIHAIH